MLNRFWHRIKTWIPASAGMTNSKDQIPSKGHFERVQETYIDGLDLSRALRLVANEIGHCTLLIDLLPKTHILYPNHHLTIKNLYS
nr:hypothetical protein [uncultured Allomuricauda sp.]